MSKNRIESLSDGIFSIVITLMVFNFKIPTDGKLSTSFYAMLFAYFTSFVLVTSFWISHHHEINALRRVDSTILWVNNLTLLPITLLPFTTGFHGTFPNSKEAALFYSGNYLLITIGLYTLGNFVSKRSDVEHDAYASHINHVRTTMMVLCIILIILAYFIPASTSFSILLATVFWVFFVTFTRKKNNISL
ncbi:TMEM175 family protein [Lactococcus nasutitermitis]|uniref:TMEM175 family protein n=1 Tax=Lactococcus nasutitermitis TaxID=1652957 RepID=A0ABV9JF25_9LACT|nr:TMEM175 family protein [Lactococcus nasutitermitis]